MTSLWMGLQARTIWLATSCGSPREYDGQYRDKVWSDPPGAVEVREWIVFLDGWHRIAHAGGYYARGKGWPPEPPSIFEFSRIYDLPLGDWAIKTANLHNLSDMLELAEKQDARHHYLASLPPEARTSLFKVERWMRCLQRDRDWALKGYIRTGPATWTWQRRLLKQ